jgi:ankyrin repeat protein
VKLLLAYANINVNPRDTYNWTPLLLAVVMGHDTTVKQLLTHPSVDVNLANHPNHGGRTPLHLAAGYGHDRVVELLLAHANVQVNARDTFNATPLLLAAWAAGMECNTTTVKQLLTRSVVEVNTPDDQGRTALHLAAVNGRSLVVHTLFSHADPQIGRVDGLSHIVNDPEEIRVPGAAEHHLRVMDLLRAHGATFS